ncbi:MAG: RNA polymerase sigma factor [Verrucomicrobiales bacterium]|jgi:RNA polymerase sigma-70 factor (ECF subfamily)|nr:RNA polymerase sigma factor [Verrucomicrobiales bacterium]
MQDHSAQWKEWLAEYGSRLLLFARQQTRSEADAEDVLQSALVKTWKTHRGAPDGKVVSLAYTNIRRCAIDLARSIDRRRLREDQSLRENFEQTSWFSLPEDDTSRALQVAMAKIPEKFREVITLKIWGEQTFDEIGKSLEISPNTAASRYRYGMDALRRCISREAIEIGV